LRLRQRYGIFIPMSIAGVLPYIQIALSVLLVVCILLQQTGASLGGAFGADNFSAGYHTRRGAELYLFWATIVIGILFAATAFVALVIPR
jgi:protein translocase SecG subunit